jgi:hypothetical protein
MPLSCWFSGAPVNGGGMNPPRRAPGGEKTGRGVILAFVMSQNQRKSSVVPEAVAGAELNRPEDIGCLDCDLAMFFMGALFAVFACLRIWNET